MEVVDYFRSAQDQDRPTGLHEWIPATSRSLYFPDFRQCPLHTGGHIVVDVFKVFNKPYLVAVPAAFNIMLVQERNQDEGMT